MSRRPKSERQKERAYHRTLRDRAAEKLGIIEKDPYVLAKIICEMHGVVYAHFGLNRIRGVIEAFIADKPLPLEMAARKVAARNFARPVVNTWREEAKAFYASDAWKKLRYKALQGVTSLRRAVPMLRLIGA